MKRLLFVMNSLTVGGAEKALVSLLQEIDYSSYEVDLMLFSHHGLFMNQIPPQVNLLPEPKLYKLFDMPVVKAIVLAMKLGRPDLAIARVQAGFVFRSNHNRAVKEQLTWKYVRKALPKLSTRYDAAIGYLEKSPHYYCIDRVNAAKVVAFIHTDYRFMGMDPLIDRPYFERSSHIFTVSESCVEILHEEFPEFREKISLMYNIVSPKTIKRLAAESSDLPQAGIRLVSVGRLSPPKGFDIAVQACRILVECGHDIRWYVIGDGPERADLERAIGENNLQKHFILSGVKENPYPYVASADIYVQPSRFEGKCIAIDEAKILCKPIVVTRFPSVADQIMHLENGYIASSDPSGIADAVEELIKDPELCRKFSENLASEVPDTAGEMEKFYSVI